MNELSRLHDIALPPAIGWWPLAPGWYAVLVLLLVVGGFGGYWGRQRFLRYRLKREALKHCDTLEARYKSTGENIFGSVSILMRRVALSFHTPKAATLTGTAWILFLKETSSPDLMDKNEEEMLRTAPYQVSAPVETLSLLTICRRWITQQG